MLQKNEYDDGYALGFEHGINNLEFKSCSEFSQHFNNGYRDGFTLGQEKYNIRYRDYIGTHNDFSARDGF